MASIPTVAIAWPGTEDGYCLINLSEYDSLHHQLFDLDSMAPVLGASWHSDRVAQLLALDSRSELLSLARGLRLKRYSKLSDDDLAAAIATAEDNVPIEKSRSDVELL